MSYRLYCADRYSVWADDNIVADNDQEALAIAQAMDSLERCEVWADNRLVASICRGQGAAAEPEPGRLSAR